MKLFKTKAIIEPEEGLWKSKYDALALYNSEVSRGIAHTDEWRKKMEQAQDEYDKRLLEYHKGRCIPYAKDS